MSSFVISDIFLSPKLFSLFETNFIFSVMSDTMILIYYSENSDESLNSIDEGISVHNEINEEGTYALYMFDEFTDPEEFEKEDAAVSKIINLESKENPGDEDEDNQENNEKKQFIRWSSYETFTFFSCYSNGSFVICLFRQ